MTVNTVDLKLKGYRLVQEVQPPPKQPVVVITEHFRCLGYMDESGQWHHLQDGALIEKVLAWSSGGWSSGTIP